MCRPQHVHAQVRPDFTMSNNHAICANWRGAWSIPLQVKKGTMAKAVSSPNARSGLVCLLGRRSGPASTRRSTTSLSCVTGGCLCVAYVCVVLHAGSCQNATGLFLTSACSSVSVCVRRRQSSTTPCFVSTVEFRDDLVQYVVFTRGKCMAMCPNAGSRCRNDLWVSLQTRVLGSAGRPAFQQHAQRCQPTSQADGRDS